MKIWFTTLFHLVFSAFVLFLTATHAIAADAHHGSQPYKLEKVAENFDIIWGLAFVDDTTALFTEKSGGIHQLNITTGASKKIFQVGEVFNHGQGGLLDVAVAPGHGENGFVYFTYARKLAGGGATTLARARLAGEKLHDWQDLFITEPVSDSGHHFGSRVAFDGAGHVFFSAGERGHRPNAQDLQTHPGSILRLNMDGTIPDDNPFTDGSGQPAIWSYGHRNPQGLAYDATTTRLWSNEHGPRGGDEINLISRGANYGWPVISHGKEYWGPVAVGEATSRAGYEDPSKIYIPSIAPGSLLVYSGKAFPLWQGNLFSSALKLKHLNRVEVDTTGKAVAEERLLTDLNERIRALAESPAGHIYFSTDSGRIYRLTPQDA